MSIAGSDSLRVIEDATCLGCACLCDDIAVVADGSRIVEARNACEMGRKWYAVGEPIPDEVPRIEGKDASLDEALDRATEVLGSARAPLVWGLAHSTIEAQRAAVAIADRVGAYLAIAGAEDAFAFQRVGLVSATLGEVRDRADVIVYDGFPSEKFPRLRERYAEGSAGRFLDGGRTARKVIRLVDLNDRSRHGDADRVIGIDGFDPEPFYASLRSTVLGLEPAAERLAKIGVDRSTLVDLAETLKGAKYGAWFGANSGARESVLRLVRDLNRFTRFVALHPPISGRNTTGARAVLAWQAGACEAADFATGEPRSIAPDETADRLIRGGFDAALLLCEGTDASNPLAWLTSRPGAALGLSKLPRVVIRPADSLGAGWSRRGVPHSINAIVHEAHVSIPTARPGIDEGGTVARFDGVMLPLRPPFPGRRVSQAEVLRGIERRLMERGR